RLECRDRIASGLLEERDGVLNDLTPRLAIAGLEDRLSEPAVERAGRNPGFLCGSLNRRLGQQCCQRRALKLGPLIPVAGSHLRLPALTTLGAPLARLALRRVVPLAPLGGLPGHLVLRHEERPPPGPGGP